MDLCNEMILCVLTSREFLNLHLEITELLIELNVNFVDLSIKAIELFFKDPSNIEIGVIDYLIESSELNEKDIGKMFYSKKTHNFDNNENIFSTEYGFLNGGMCIVLWRLMIARYN